MFVMSWVGINPVQTSRSVRTVLFHGQNASHFGHGIVATVTVYIAPDDGRTGHPKHVEHTCSC